MSKIKIEIRKPQYLGEQGSGVAPKAGGQGGETPFFFRLLLVASYALSGLAIWYVFQRFAN